jgi:oligoendopeptidase F
MFYEYKANNRYAIARNYKSYIDSALKADSVDEKFLLDLYSFTENLKPQYLQYKKTKESFIKKIYKYKDVEP